MKVEGVVAALLSLAPVTGVAEESWPSQDTAAIEVSLEVGQTLAICGTGAVTCPASGFCDDPKVATGAGTPSGLGWKAVGVGVTLCSAGAASGAGQRRVFRVHVIPARAP
jgi:hypothetical protein